MDTEKTFEQQVVDSLKEIRSISDVIYDVCKMSDGEFAIHVNEDSCILYSRSDSDASSTLGHELITYASVAIHEIERLNDLGIVSVFQSSARNLITIGDKSLVGNTAIAYNITNDKLVQYMKMDVYGGKRLTEYIENGYKTNEEVLALKNLEIAQDTLKKTRSGVWIAVVIFILSAILNIALKFV